MDMDAAHPKTVSDSVNGIAYIHSLGRFSGTPGLHRIRALCEALGNPQEQLKFIHLAGTNGKGSTACMTASVLQAAGYRVGLYTSPYLIRFHERIRVNGVEIADQDLVRLTEQVAAVSKTLVLPKKETIGAFEFTTALAFLYFLEQGCDIVVLETGLGGRYDATNIIRAPEVCVITPVSQDHTEILGDTIPQIAAEKAAIIKPGAQVVCAPDQAQDAVFAIRAACKTAQAVFCNYPLQYRLLRCDLNGSAFVYEKQGYTIAMPGFHQIKNALTALHTIMALRDRGWAVPETAAIQGLARARMPGRLERLRETPLVLLDGAHNSNGIAALGRFAEDMLKMRRLHIIMGMMRDKQYERCIRSMAAHAHVFYACAPGDKEYQERALPSQTVAAIAAQCCQTVHDCGSAEQAIRIAIQAAQPEDCVFICGSFYLVGEAEKILRSRQKPAE